MSLYENSNKKPRKIKPTGADGHRSRMFTKFLNAAGRDILPRDLLEMALYFSIPVRDTRDSAVELMSYFQNNIRTVLNAPSSELEKIDGVGPESAVLLNLLGHIALRLESEDSDDRTRYTTIDDICTLFMQNYNFPEEDELWVAFFDNSMRAIIHKFKSEPIEIYTDDIYELFALSAKYHSNTFAIARMSSAKSVYPTIRDNLIHQFIRSTLEGSPLKMLDYYISTADEAISISKPIE